MSAPRIFNTKRRAARVARARALQQRPDAARFVMDDMVEEALDRLAFVRQPAGKALVIGDWTGRVSEELSRLGHGVTAWSVGEVDEELPYPVSGFDLIISLGTLDTVNDLPGALVHIRNALAPGGLAIASFVGGASLGKLRRAMLEADGDRPAARVHPLVDNRAAPGLLQRAGWADPVVDTQRLTVRYGSLDRLVQDLREQGLGNVLASSAPPLNRAALAKARQAFLNQADADGRVSETFEIVTLTGRRPSPRF